MKPQYPVYIISKGRADVCLTANFFVRDELDFRIVVEPEEKKAYASKYGAERIIVLPFSNLGLGSIPARNFCWEHSIKEGHKRHWIFDDNIRNVRRLVKGYRVPMNANIALAAIEDFTERYENIAISGMNYTMFAIQKCPPFILNAHIYSNLLILNELPYRWRGRYNEDTDLCLQVLSGNWCTVQFNAFLIEKMQTMVMKGGNSDVLYQGDGRLTMAKSLERVWPGVVKTTRRFNRPQHKVHKDWKHFDQPLIRRKDIDWDKIKEKTYDIGIKVIKEGPAAERIKGKLQS